MSQAGVEAAGRDWGLFARAAGYGAATAFALFYALHFGVGVRPRQASGVAFPLAALPFAVGLIGWSGVLLSGDAVEGFSRELGVSDTWTAESGRQAMALVIAFGAGGMAGAAIAGAPYGV
ncbi:hypothetical protein PNQ29_01130 [Halobacterium salinarum]|uniref:DUF7268 family protein n=1 Tax=Halobacterium salinarum TaxID=2242 RepID=UPI001F157312|nr:hypothetical protein [Halobacterium salinarum]MCF2208551.1 hypothetical protein [Halobacterium salinarum]MDL0118359.1 hypothetical protein [Halobacterium salinarum]